MELFKNKQQPAEMQQIMQNIAKTEEEIQEKLYQLGVEYYERNKDNKEIEPNLYARLDVITKLNENRKSFYMNKLRLEGKMVCANCGEVIPYGSVFCNVCGKKADEKQGDGNMSKRKNVKTCSVCGAELEEGDLFCIQCGNKISKEEEA